MANPNPNYALGHAQLPLLASGTGEITAPKVVAGTPLNATDWINAANQHHERKHLNRRVPPLATDDEVLDSKRRKLAIEAEHFAPGGLAAMQNTLNTINATLAALSATVNHATNGLAALSATVNHPTSGLAALSATLNHPTNGLAALSATVNHPSTTGLAAVSHRLDAETARNVNRSCVRTYSDATVPVPSNTGIQPPQWFSTISLDQISDLPVNPANQQGLNGILNFYDAANEGDNRAKINRIKKLLGITI